MLTNQANVAPRAGLHGLPCPTADGFLNRSTQRSPARLVVSTGHQSRKWATKSQLFICSIFPVVRPVHSGDSERKGDVAIIQSLPEFFQLSQEAMQFILG